MYFEQENVFSSLNQSNQDLQKMMDLSASNDEYILPDIQNGKSNFNSNPNHETLINYSSFGQEKQPMIIDS